MPDLPDGRWVTMRGRRVFIPKDGEPDLPGDKKPDNDHEERLQALEAKVSRVHRTLGMNENPPTAKPPAPPKSKLERAKEWVLDHS